MIIRACAFPILSSKSAKSMASRPISNSSCADPPAVWLPALPAFHPAHQRRVIGFGSFGVTIDRMLCAGNQCIHDGLGTRKLHVRHP